MRLTDLLLAIALGALLSAGTADLSRSAAEAQSARVSFQSSSGAISSVFTVEMLAALWGGLYSMVAEHDEEGHETVGTTGIVLLSLLGAAVVGSAVAVAVAAQEENLSAEVPYVGHNLIFGAVAATGVSAGITTLVVEEPGPEIAGAALAGLLVGGVGIATYTGLRLRELVFDPDLVEEAHFLAWAPVGVGLVAGLIGFLAEWEGAPLLVGLTMMATYLVGIGLAEAAIANDTTPVPAPAPLRQAPSGTPMMPMMVGWSGTF